MSSPSRPPSLQMNTCLLSSPLLEENDPTKNVETNPDVTTVPTGDGMQKTVHSKTEKISETSYSNDYHNDKMAGNEENLRQESENYYHIHIYSEENPKNDVISEFTESCTFNQGHEIEHIEQMNDKLDLDYVTDEVVSMIKEVEHYRDELQMISVHNATLLDYLAMTGANV